MNYKLMFLAFVSIVALYGCSFSEKFEPIVITNSNGQDGFNVLTDEQLLEKYNKNHSTDETLSSFLTLEMDGDYEGKEIFVLSNTKDTVYFRVFSYNEEKESFKNIFERATAFDENNPYFVDGILPFTYNETQHVLIGKHLNPGMNYYFFLVGKTPESNEISVLIDNALNENPQPIFNGSAAIGRNSFTIEEDSKFIEEYSQTTTGYRELTGKIN